jgi:hypothetical protein
MGRVRDALFDDQGWAVRYLVVDSGGWLSRREAAVTTPPACRDHSRAQAGGAHVTPAR